MIREGHQDLTPVQQGGNRMSRMRRAGVGLVVSGLMITGCTDSVPTDAIVTPPTTAIAPNVATPKEVLIKEQLDKAKSDMAAKVIEQAKSKTSIAEDKVYGSLSSDLTVAIIRSSETTVGGARGEYYAATTFSPENFGSLDPNKAQNIHITMDSFESEYGSDSDSHGSFYAFHLTQVGGDSNSYNLIVAHTLNGERVSKVYSTDVSDGDLEQNPNVQKLTPEVFEPLLAEAMTVYSWMDQGQPVQAPPLAR